MEKVSYNKKSGAHREMRDSIKVRVYQYQGVTFDVKYLGNR